MTLQQTLEKLAAVAGDWLHWRVDSNGICSIYIKEYIQLSGYTVEQTLSKKNLSLLFGAICEKVEAEGWDYEISRENIEEEGVSYLFFIEQEHIYKELGRGNSSVSLTHAAAQALLAALEAKTGVCKDCRGRGYRSAPTDAAIYNGRRPCISCQGTGKQSNQQEQINE